VGENLTSMQKILFTQTVFAPSKAKTERNLNSVRSLKKYLDKYPYPLDIYFGGFASEEFRKYTFDTIQNLFPDANVSQFDKNFGKAYVINKITKMATDSNNYKYMFTADSDVLFDVTEPNVFNRMVECAEFTEKIKNKPFGLLGINLKEGNCNIIKLLRENVRKFTNSYGQEEEIIWNNYPGHIAGGGLFISMDAWKEVGGYRVLGVFGSTDAYLLIDMKNKGKTWQLAQNIYIIHPPEKDLQYQIWKRKFLNAGKILTEEELLKKVEEVEEFWKTHKD